jgi:hypothetical protein
LLVAAALLGATAWLHGAAFAYFREAEAPALPAALRKALRHLPPLLVLVLAAVAFYAGLSWWDGYSSRPAFHIASFLTLKLRTPVKPSGVLTVFRAALWLVEWVVLPLVLLPLASGVASTGWQGFRECGALLPQRRYWLLAPALLLCALWLPWRLVHWTPLTGAFGIELLSLLVRFTVAYLFFVGAWLALSFVTSRGSPSRSQLSTVSSP